MITFETERDFEISQASYEACLKRLPFQQMRCPCGNAGALVRYGSYIRRVKIGGREAPLAISGLKCKVCNRTHAVLPSFIVPYRQSNRVGTGRNSARPPKRTGLLGCDGAQLFYRREPVVFHCAQISCLMGKQIAFAGYPSRLFRRVNKNVLPIFWNPVYADARREYFCKST